MSLAASAIVFALLYAKYVAGNIHCGKLKRQLGGGPPEDRKFQTSEPPAPNAALQAKYERWCNISSNDKEVLPLGALAMFLSVGLGGRGARRYCAHSALVRVVHSALPAHDLVCALWAGRGAPRSVRVGRAEQLGLGGDACRRIFSLPLIEGCLREGQS